MDGIAQFVEVPIDMDMDDPLFQGAIESLQTALPRGCAFR